MKFQGAVIKEQGVTFAIIIVKLHVVNNAQESARVIQSFERQLGVTTVLMGQDHQGSPKYYGRRDIVKFLSKISISRISWKEYTLH